MILVLISGMLKCVGIRRMKVMGSIKPRRKCSSNAEDSSSLDTLNSKRRDHSDALLSLSTKEIACIDDGDGDDDGDGNGDWDGDGSPA